MTYSYMIMRPLTLLADSVSIAAMARNTKTSKRRGTRNSQTASARSSSLKTKGMPNGNAPRSAAREIVDPRVQQQLKQYEEAVRYFQQQKFHKAKEILEKVTTGPSKELADRAQVHLRVCEQRISRLPTPVPRSPEEHYQRGVAMMNLGHWDEAREHLLRARKLAPKADYVFYAMAALDCLTGEAESAMENLKVAIDLRPENRYHARNDEDFAFLQEDPRFTELLYPEREGSGG
jgi:tetratricopeptide (TPR) repeat protein